MWYSRYSCVQASRDELLEALAVLEKLYAANEQASPGLPVTDFENLELSEGLNLTREYSEYRKWMVSIFLPILRTDLVANDATRTGTLVCNALEQLGLRERIQHHKGLRRPHWTCQTSVPL